MCDVEVDDVLDGDRSEDEKVAVIIERYAFAAGVLACQPFPIADWLILAPLEGAMAVHIAKARGVAFGERDLRELWDEIGLAGGLIVAAPHVVLGLYKFIPYFGIATTVPTVFAVVFAMGHVIDAYIAAKERHDKVTLRALKEIFGQQFAVGKAMGKKRLQAIKERWRRRKRTAQD